MPEITNTNFESAWDEMQGSFYVRLANNFIAYKSSDKKGFKTALDISCKTSNFLNVLHGNGIKCFGYDTSKSMINYSNKKYPKINYKYSENIIEIPFKSSFDIITCNHDAINDLSNISDVSMLFKNVNKHLSNHGVFLFDFYTKDKIENSSLSFETSPNIDCVTKFKSINSDQAMVNLFFYITDQDGNTTKLNKIMKKFGYEVNDILEELKKNGFKNVTIVNEELTKIDNYDNAERIYVIAMKK